MDSAELLERALDKDQRALARVITIIERDDAAAQQILGRIDRNHSATHIIGVTGPPGAGKSSLLGRLAAQLSESDRSVAILAVDPTSPLTGGATLGDRIRMRAVATQPNVFVRSVASRSRTDGLSPSIASLTALFSAAQFDAVFIETVGSGQNQVRVRDYAHTTMLVEAPGAGDSVQMLKAGIMELADIYVVAKSDMPGAHLVARELRSMLTLSQQARESWRPPVHLTSAETDVGVEGVLQALDDHRHYLTTTGEFDRRIEAMIRADVLEAMTKVAERALVRHPRLLSEFWSPDVVPEKAAIRLMQWIVDEAPDRRRVSSPDGQ
jgi:LAO/AO transport system kinase